MNSEKMTQKSLDAIESAHSEAVRRRHSELTTFHLLQALLNQEQGLVPKLLEKMEVPVVELESRVDESLKNLPTFNGSNPGRVTPSGEISQILVQAEDEAKRLQDDYLKTPRRDRTESDAESRRGSGTILSEEPRVNRRHLRRCGV